MIDNNILLDYFYVLNDNESVISKNYNNDNDYFEYILIRFLLMFKLLWDEMV